MPKDNVEDLVNIPKVILDNMEVIPISNFNEVYTKLFKWDIIKIRMWGKWIH